MFPWRQRPLAKVKAEDAAKVDHTKRHPRELCDKCKALGFYCAESRRGYSDDDKEQGDDSVRWQHDDSDDGDDDDD